MNALAEVGRELEIANSACFAITREGLLQLLDALTEEEIS